MKNNEIRKSLVLIVVLLCTTIAYAQKDDSSFMVAPADSTKEISLTQRIDSLEHELSYIKLSYELYILANDLYTFTNNISIASNKIEIKIYTRIFDYELYKSYKDLYDAKKAELLSFQELIEVKKTYFWLKIITYPYTDDEKKVLLSSYRIIDKGYSTLEASLKVMKINLDIYKDSL